MTVQMPLALALTSKLCLSICFLYYFCCKVIRRLKVYLFPSLRTIVLHLKSFCTYGGQHNLKQAGTGRPIAHTVISTAAELLRGKGKIFSHTPDNAAAVPMGLLGFEQPWAALHCLENRIWIWHNCQVSAKPSPHSPESCAGQDQQSSLSRLHNLGWGKELAQLTVPAYPAHSVL